LKWSLNKSTVKLIQSLKQQKFRREHGLFVVEGRKMVEELLQTNMKTLCIFATERFLHDYEIQDERLEIATEVQMEQMSGQDTPPGIFGCGEDSRARRHSFRRHGPGFGRNRQSRQHGHHHPHGGVVWHQAGVCSEDCVELWNPKVIQATMGSVFRMSVVSTDLERFLKESKSKGKAVYGALLEGESIFKKEGRWPEGVIVIGSESHGIRSNILPFDHPPHHHSPG
jgi:rRNA methylases